MYALELCLLISAQNLKCLALPIPKIWLGGQNYTRH